MKKSATPDEGFPSSSISPEHCSNRNTNSLTVQSILSDQNESERSKLRSLYMQLLEDTQNQRNALIDPESDLLTKRVNEVDSLFLNVKMPREAVLDSRLLQTFAELGKQKAQALDTSLVAFEPLEFAEKLITFMKCTPISTEGRSQSIFSDENWIHLGETFSTTFKKSPPFHYMYGSFEPGSVELKSRRKRRVLKDSDLKKAISPETINMGDSKLQQEKTTEQIERILSILHKVYKIKKSPISYFEFVINPESFSETVENIFHTSFLIKDEAAVLYLDDDSIPVLEPVLLKTPPDNTRTKHLIISLSEEEYNDIIKLFNIKKCLIPSRHQ